MPRNTPPTFNKDLAQVLEVLDDALAEWVFSKEGLDADDAGLQALSQILGGALPTGRLVSLNKNRQTYSAETATARRAMARRTKKAFMMVGVSLTAGGARTPYICMCAPVCLQLDTVRSSDDANYRMVVMGTTTMKRKRSSVHTQEVNHLRIDVNIRNVA